MNGYLKAELYRLKKKRLNLLIFPVLVVLIILLAVVLEYFAKVDPSFPYGNTLFYYSNVFGMSTFLLLIVCILAIFLLGKDRHLIPVTIALGTERKVIYFNKLFISFINFSTYLLLLGLTVYLSGSFLISQDNEGTSMNFLISSMNLLPVLISAFVMCFVVTIILDNEIIGIISVFIMYKGLAIISLILTSRFSQLEDLSKFLPANTFNDIMKSFMDGKVQFELSYWIVNIVLTLIMMWIGYRAFEKKDYI